MFEDKSNANRAAAADGSVITDDPEAVRSHAYELAFASDDEMFQSTLYDWLIERGLADDLLEVGRRAIIVEIGWVLIDCRALRCALHI